MGLEPASVRQPARGSVRPFTLSDMNILETSWPIKIKFNLKHHWAGGLAALGFGPDWIRTLVSMAKIAPIGLLWGKSCEHSSSSINEPVHEISNNVVCATSKASDRPAHTRSLIRAFASRLSIL